MISHKSSGSNRLAYQGLLTDYHILKYGSHVLGQEGPRTTIYNNILLYLELLKDNKIPTRRFLGLLQSLEDLLNVMKSDGLALPHKKSISGTGLSQFAFKEEAAGKLRVFAILDSISQSVLKPLHDHLFDILRRIPNDGTFDQDASVKRSSEKMAKYGIAYSFDLSAATDRLPVSLTSSILENIVGLKGFGKRWEALMVDRDFYIPKTQHSLYFGDDPNLLGPIRYAVGQPMGGLSS